MKAMIPNAPLYRTVLAQRALYPRLSTRKLAIILRTAGLRFSDAALRQALRPQEPAAPQQAQRTRTAARRSVPSCAPHRAPPAQSVPPHFSLGPAAVAVLGRFARRTFPSCAPQLADTRRTFPSCPPQFARAAPQFEPVGSRVRELSDDQDRSVSPGIVCGSTRDMNNIYIKLNKLSASSSSLVPGDNFVELRSTQNGKKKREDPMMQPRSPRPAGTFAPPSFETVGAANLCKAIWAQLERHYAKPQGSTYTGWKARNMTIARELISSGMSHQAVMDAWEQYWDERGEAVYTLGALQRFIMRKGAEERGSALRSDFNDPNEELNEW